MKHTLLYVLAFAMLCSVAGCSRQEDNIFDQSAADRLHAMEQAVRTNLISSSNGWEFRYFPYPDEPGYALLARFHEDGTVTIAAKNSVSSKNTYKEETTLWGMDGTQGCVLTFHSYNTLFSIFADPLSDGIGYNGDYEFVVLQNDANTLRLKGKKHGAYVTMNRMSEATTWKQYYDAIDQFNAETFTGNDGIEMSYWDGAKTISVVYNKGAFTYKEDNEEQNRGFLVTPTGVHFYSGLPMNGTSALAQDFVLSDDKQILKTQDGKAFISSKYTAADFFVYRFANYSRWIYMSEGTDSKTLQAVKALQQAANAGGAQITTMAYERSSTTDKMGHKVYEYALHVTYTAEGKQFGGRINFNHSIVSNTISFTYKSHDEALDPLFKRMNLEEGAENAFCAVFAGQFTAESYTGSALNMSHLSLKKTDGTSIHIQAERIIL